MGVLGLAQGLAFRARRCEPIPILKSALLRVARHYANQGPGRQRGDTKKRTHPLLEKRHRVEEAPEAQQRPGRQGQQERQALDSLLHGNGETKGTFCTDRRTKAAGRLY